MIVNEIEEEFIEEFEELTNNEETDFIPKKTSNKKKDLPIKKNNEEKGPFAKKIPIPEGAKRKIKEQARELKKNKILLNKYKRELDRLKGEAIVLRDELTKTNQNKLKLEQQVLEKEQYIAAYEKKLKRLQKDFERFKKRSEKEINKEAKKINKSVFLDFIEVMDTFERALVDVEKRVKGFQNKNNVNAILTGLEGIRSQILSLLKRHEIEMIDPIGEAFDPRYQEAIDVVGPKKREGKKIVKEVISKGYKIGEYLLRPARVILTIEEQPPEIEELEEIKGEEFEEEIEEIKEGEFEELEDFEEVPEELESLDESPMEDED